YTHFAFSSVSRSSSHLILLFFFLLLRRLPISTLFPYTTLFRSSWHLVHSLQLFFYCPLNSSVIMLILETRKVPSVIGYIHSYSHVFTTLTIIIKHRA